MSVCFVRLHFLRNDKGENNIHIIPVDKKSKRKKKDYPA